MGPGFVFPANLDPANILGRTDLDYENFNFFSSYLLDPEIWQAGPGLGQAWAGPWTAPGPGLGRVWARLGHLIVMKPAANLQGMAGRIQPLIQSFYDIGNLFGLFV